MEPSQRIPRILTNTSLQEVLKAIGSSDQQGHSIELSQTLRRHKLFTGWKDSALKRVLIDDKTVFSFEPGESLCRWGEPVAYLLMILSGKAKAEIAGNHEAQPAIVLDLLMPGHVLGLLSLIDGGPHSATVVATERVTAAALNFAEMRKALDKQPQWYRIFAEIASHRVRNNGSWLQALLS